jgi:hypothetical protein
VIRRLVVLGGVALVVRRFFTRRRKPSERVAIGKADGATVVLEPGAPGREALIVAAGRALLP